MYFNNKTYFLHILFLFWGSRQYLVGQAYQERLLSQQQVIGNRSVSADEILSIIPQKPNKKFPLTPFRHKLYFYNKGKVKHNKQLAEKVFENKISKINAAFAEKSKGVNADGPYMQKLKARRDKKIEKYQRKINDGNWLMTNFGEPPVYYSASETIKNTEKITKYLYNKGYFNARVNYLVDSSQAKLAKVSYIITENQPFTFKEVHWNVNNKKIETALQGYKGQSLAKVGKQFDKDLLDIERLQIENYLRDEGYYLFTRNQIRYQVQYLPNEPENGVKLNINVSDEPEGVDKQYTIDEVTFIIDASGLSDLNNKEVKIDTLRMNDINYIFAGDHFSTRFLHKKIFLKPGNLYKLSDQYETQKALLNLDQFKFANPSFDTTGSNLKVRFYAIPLEKYQFTGESGLNVFQSIPGPFINASLKIRNIFGGLESLENQVRLGYEGQRTFGTKDKRYSLETGFNSSVNIPLILLPGSYARLDRYNPHTQIGLGFNYSDRLEYRRLNFRLAANYSWQVSQRKQYNFSLVDLNLINTPYLSDSFDSTLTALKLIGNNLRESFGKSFVSSISGSYIYNDNFLGQNQKGRYLRLYSELGGNLLNFSKNNEIGLVNKILGNNLNYFKFVRLLAEYRRYIPVAGKSNNIIAYRFNTGLAVSYNKNSNALPYEKYLFAGGSYSLRGWQPRRVGLNRYNNTENAKIDYKLEQPGNVLLESSIEYRFPLLKMYGQLNGAVFADAGNVWTLPDKSGVERSSDFKVKNLFKQMAMDTGFGLRYDFTYFVIRLDAAAKVIEPLYNSNKFVLDDFFKKGKDSNLNLNWNIGIGYPF